MQAIESIARACHFRRSDAILSPDPGREVSFALQHVPGRLAASDFTHKEELNVTIQGRRFDHLIYLFVLTYSNWEAGTVCFSERFESLSELQEPNLNFLVAKP